MANAKPLVTADPGRVPMVRSFTLCSDGTNVTHSAQIVVHATSGLTYRAYVTRWVGGPRSAPEVNIDVKLFVGGRRVPERQLAGVREAAREAFEGAHDLSVRCARNRPPYVYNKWLAEKAIAMRVVTDALAQGYEVEVRDGGDEPAVPRTRDAGQIRAALHDADEQWLVVYGREGHRLGTVALVYGNGGWDVISDYTDTPAMVSLMAGAESMVEAAMRDLA